MSKSVYTQPIWHITSTLESADKHNLSAFILQQRGFSTQAIDKFLSPSYHDDLADPLLLSGVEDASRRIYQAIEEHQSIVIYGDYDIDGITACAVLYDVLTRANANVEIYIPDRFEEGYGLHSPALKTIKDNGADLVITVDCGITAIKEAEYAHNIGLDLIITDHHTLADSLPNHTVALINPKLSTSTYPEKDLAGVGVAFTLVRGLQTMYPDLLELGQEKWLLDLVALGTICDIVPLTGENRVLASFGLKVMRKSKRVGLQALARVSATELSEVTEGDLGFRFGPRLNAAGRLEHARAAQELLITHDSAQANELAEKLNILNRERVAQTQEILAEAEKQAKKQKEHLVLVLHHSDWNSGIVGIVASNITEKFHKPAILLQTNGKKAKGSARSIADFSIIDAISSCRDLLDKYGGHMFAAGLSLSTDNIALFTHKINEFAKNNVNIESWLPTLEIDCMIQSFQPELQDIEQLEDLQPYGNNNPQPLLATQLKLVMVKPVGQQLNHQKFQFETLQGKRLDGISFFSTHKWPDLTTNTNYNVAFYLQKNTWQDITRVQVEVKDIQPLNTKNKQNSKKMPTKK